MLPALVLLAIAALTWPAVANAKFTCEERGKRPQGFILQGLPAAPVAERAYPLTVSLLRQRHGVNPTPYLGAEPCDGGPEGMPGAGGWFRRVDGGGYVFSLRFPEPGRWALSFMDRGGSFHDIGIRVVTGGPEGWFAPAVERLLSAAVQRP